MGCLLLCPGESKAQRWLGVRSEGDTLPEDKKGFFIMPLLYFTPDTRWAAGAAGVYYFSLEDEKSIDNSRLSYAQFLTDYTQNEQLDVWGIWNIFTPDEDYLFKGEARFRNFPDRFYGIGNASPEEAMERYSYDYLSFKALFMKRIHGRWFAGIDYHLEREYNFDLSDDGRLRQGDIVGYRGGVGSGLGVVSTYDSRDNVINAIKGQLVEFSTFFYRDLWGSDFQFTQINAEHRFYHQIKGRHVLATQSRLAFNLGDVPFLDMNTAGGDDILRGYAMNRYRDRHFWGAQTEYRFPIWKRLGGVGFAGVGDVFAHERDLRWDRLKYSYGLGLRLTVNPNERLNIRFDYAWGRDASTFYFMVTEAF